MTVPERTPVSWANVRLSFDPPDTIKLPDAVSPPRDDVPPRWSDSADVTALAEGLFSHRRDPEMSDRALDCAWASSRNDARIALGRTEAA